MPTRASDHTTQYFEMFGSRSIFHDGWKANCPVPGPSFAEAAERGRRFGQALTADDARGPRRERMGAVPTWTTTRPRHGTWRPTEPERLAEMIALWYDQAERVRRVPARVGGHQPTADRPPDDRGAARRTRLVPRRRSRVLRCIAAALQPPVQHHRRRRRSPTVARTGSSPPTGAATAATHSSCSTGGCTTSTTSSASTRFPRGRATTSSRPGDHELRYEFAPNRRTRPRRRPRLARQQPAAPSTAGSSRARALPYTTTNRMAPVGFSCGYAAFDSVDPGRLRRAVPVQRHDPSRHHRHLRATSIAHDEAELRSILAQQ